MPKAASKKKSQKKVSGRGRRPGAAKGAEEAAPPSPAVPAVPGSPRLDLLDVLSKSQQFYIRGNMEVLSAQQIASDLSLPVDVVAEYISTVAHSPDQTRTGKLFQRPARGVVAMTEAASMRGDDFRRGSVVTQAEINQAALAGNYELAANLARQREGGVADHAARQQASQGHFIHRPRGGGWEPDIDGRPAK